jgi:hypothetical protein
MNSYYGVENRGARPTGRRANSSSSRHQALRVVLAPQGINELLESGRETVVRSGRRREDGITTATLWDLQCRQEGHRRRLGLVGLIRMKVGRTE